jgi:small subunit ribosomal protein S20
LTPRPVLTISLATAARFAALHFFEIHGRFGDLSANPHQSPTRDEMANTSSARKATRKIARKTEINKTRRTLLRNSVRRVEEAIAGGDPKVALAAFKAAEPVIMRAAQRNVVHKNTASRKVSRLAHRIAKLGK